MTHLVRFSYASEELPASTDSLALGWYCCESTSVRRLALLELGDTREDGERVLGIWRAVGRGGWSLWAVGCWLIAGCALGVSVTSIARQRVCFA